MKLVSQAKFQAYEEVQMDNKSLSHTRWKCQYHIVFIPKYRKKILYGKVREDVREILSTLCKYKNVDIIAGAVCADHVHLSVAIPPKLSISNFMGYLKGKSTLMIFKGFSFFEVENMIYLFYRNQRGGIFDARNISVLWN